MKLEIDYDSDSETALVSMNGRPALEWDNAELSLHTLLDEVVKDGWLVRTPKAQMLSFSAGRLSPNA